MPARAALAQVLLDHGGDVARREGVQVELLADREDEGLAVVVHGARVSAAGGGARGEREEGGQVLGVAQLQAHVRLADRRPRRSRRGSTTTIGQGETPGERRARGVDPAAAQRARHHVAEVAAEDEQRLRHVLAGEALVAQRLDLRVDLLQAARRVVEVEPRTPRRPPRPRAARGRTRCRRTPETGAPASRADGCRARARRRACSPGSAPASARPRRASCPCAARSPRPGRAPMRPTVEVARLGMREVPAADRRGRQHREGLGQRDAGAAPARRAARTGGPSRCGRGRRDSPARAGCRGSARGSAPRATGARRGRSPTPRARAGAAAPRAPRPGGRPAPWP